MRRIAGEIGVEFRDKTLRELLDMRYGAWEKASSVMCLLANINRDSKAKPEPFNLSDFHPMREKVKRQPDIMCGKGSWPKIEKLAKKG
jgi:hypothetical protein